MLSHKLLYIASGISRMVEDHWIIPLMTELQDRSTDDSFDVLPQIVEDLNFAQTFLPSPIY